MTDEQRPGNAGGPASPRVGLPEHLRQHQGRAVHFFGDHVAFDKEAWLRDGR